MSSTLRKFFGKKSVPKPVDAINGALRAGVGVARYRISREQGLELKAIREQDGHDAALRRLLEMLRAPKGN